MRLINANNAKFRIVQLVKMLMSALYAKQIITLIQMMKANAYNVTKTVRIVIAIRENVKFAWKGTMSAPETTRNVYHAKKNVYNAIASMEIVVNVRVVLILIIQILNNVYCAIAYV